jgi:hypothetical protein
MAIDINIPSQVKNYANLAGFPATGSLKTIYIAEDTNKTYRWTGSAYVEISASQAAAWGTITGTLSTQTDLQTALNAKVTGNTAITGATKTKVTYDSKGLVTAGADATTADIADSLNKRYVTDANLTTIGNQSGVNTGDQTLAGLGGVPTTRTLTINGTTQDLSADRTFTISTGITIGTTAITSGTVGRILFEGTGNVVQESANLFWDNTNGRLGIGTSSPTTPINIVSSTNAALFVKIQNNNSGALATTGYEMQSNTAYGSIFATSSNYTPYGVLGASQIGFYTSNTFAIALDSSSADFKIGVGTSAVERFRIKGNTGNVLINTTTDAGYKLDVNGTARVSGPSGYSMVYDSNGVFNLNGTYARLDLFNQSGSLRARLNCDGPNGTLTLCQNASGYVFFNGAQSANDNFINGAVSIGKNAVAATTSILELTSTTKGFLPPRMTTTQKNAIASPATGLMVYDTTLNLMALYNGTTWTTL